MSSGGYLFTYLSYLFIYYVFITIVPIGCDNGFLSFFFFLTPSSLIVLHVVLAFPW